MTTTFTLLLSLTAAALAQSSSSSGSNAVQTVMVGEGGLNFSPNSITASPGDQIEFHFASTGHSVAQGSFDNPCMPSGDDAFYSGFASPRGPPFTLTINSTDPLWFYCSASGHCQGGMVGVINAPSGQTQSDYANAAANAADSESPAQVQGGVFASAQAPTSMSMSSASGTMSGTSATAGASTSSMSGTMSETSATAGASMSSMSASTSETSAMAAASSSIYPGAAAVATPVVGLGAAAGVAMFVAGLV